MGFVLVVLQVLLALHTLMGAVWKFSHTAGMTMPSLSAIPDGVWLAMSVIEILCAVALALPLWKRNLARWAPIGAIVIALEMIFLCVVHVRSGADERGPMGYWLVVAAVCAFVAFARLRFKR